MSRVVGALLALWVSAGVAALRAQGPRRRVPDTRVLLARAESLQTQIDLRDSLARRAVERQRMARRFSAGGVTVLLAGVADEAVGARVATRAATLLDSLGVLPPGFFAAHVVVAAEASGVDSVLRAEGLAGRARVRADFGSTLDTLTAGFVAAAALVRTYQSALDAAWRSWAPGGLTLNWMEGREGEAARRELLGGEFRVGAKCLTGDVAECARWLGVSREDHPFRTRYSPDELRRVVTGGSWEYGPNWPAARDCLHGSDEACVRFAESGRHLDPIPAGSSARSSLLRAVWTVHGPAALRRALADSSGPVGERLARASGVSADSLLAEWRVWLLTGGGGRRVTAAFADALPVVFFGALLLFAAARSARWR